MDARIDGDANGQVAQAAQVESWKFTFFMTPLRVSLFAVKGAWNHALAPMLGAVAKAAFGQLGVAFSSIATIILRPFRSVFYAMGTVLFIGGAYWMWQAALTMPIFGRVLKTMLLNFRDFMGLPVVDQFCSKLGQTITDVVDQFCSKLGQTITDIADRTLRYVSDFFLREGIGGGLMIGGNWVGRILWDIGIGIIKNTSFTTWKIVGAYLTTLFAIRYTGQIIQELIAYYGMRSRYLIDAPVLTIDFHKGGLASLPVRIIASLFPSKKLKPIFNRSIQTEIDLFAKRVQKSKAGERRPNLLLSGPPGTGKTMVAKSIALANGMSFVAMNGGDLAQYIKKGTHVSELNKLIEFAKKYRAIIFIDECEALCGHRDKLDQAHTELADALLKETGEGSDRISLILATNRYWELDPAFLSRMDAQLQVDNPDYDCRFQILKQNFDANPRFRRKNWLRGSTPLITEDTIKSVAARTYGLSGRALVKMVDNLAAQKKHTGTLTEEMIDGAVGNFVKQSRGVNILARSWIWIQEMAAIAYQHLIDIWYFSIMPMLKDGNSQLAQHGWKKIPFTK